MHAFVMFANQCLGTLSYEAIAPAIAMASLIVIWLVDFAAARFLSNRGSMQNLRAPESPNTIGAEKTEAGLGNLGHDHDFSSIDSASLIARPDSRRARWEVELLEAGICFHRYDAERA